jgi:ribosome-binding factor A
MVVMSKRRMPRLNEQFRREIAELLHHEVKDPRVGTTTVTEARVAPDLSSARIFVALPPGDDPDDALAGLAAATAFIRGALGRRLQIRRVPELIFEIDDSLSHAMRIERLLQQVRPAAEEQDFEEGGEAGEGGEGGPEADAGR